MSFMLLRFRITFYTAVILMHLSNILYMEWYTDQARNLDPKAMMFKKLEFRFLSTWNYAMQISYCMVGITCDTMAMRSRQRPNKPLEVLKELREITYNGLIFPAGLVISILFWGLYIYDRSLIFPESLDAVMSPLSVHVAHTVIVPVALFDVVFRPRPEPTFHLKYVSQTILNLSMYTTVLMITHKQHKTWLYPILDELDGTEYFYFVLAVAAAMFLIFYYVQWPLARMIHRKKEVKPVKKTKTKKPLIRKVNVDGRRRRR